ncbi:hypothetical protein L6452_47018 [Arctium lappa]|nr:hypothetical protein L6452_47018 [Arctium lappa]
MGIVLQGGPHDSSVARAWPTTRAFGGRGPYCWSATGGGHTLLSWLFDARGKAPEEAVPQSVPRPAAATRSRRGSSSSSPPTADGFGTGTPVPSPQSQSFSEVTDPFCRLPLPTLFHRPEAVHLGDRCGYEYDRAWEALGPPDFQGPPGGAPDTARLPFTWNLSPLRPSKFSFEYLLLPPRSAPTAAAARAHAQGFAATAAPSYSSGPGTCPDGPGVGRALKRHPFSGLVSAQFGTVTRLPVHPASPVLLTKNGPLGALDSVARLNEAAARPTYLKFENRSRALRHRCL